jgi:hypothetical protein
MAEKRGRSPKAHYARRDGGLGTFRWEDTAWFRALPASSPGDMPPGAWDRVFPDGYLRLKPGLWARWDGKGTPRETTLGEAAEWFGERHLYNVANGPGPAVAWETESGLPEELVRDMRAEAGEIKVRGPDPGIVARNAQIWDMRENQRMRTGAIAAHFGISDGAVRQALSMERKRRGVRDNP